MRRGMVRGGRGEVMRLRGRITPKEVEGSGG